MRELTIQEMHNVDDHKNEIYMDSWIYNNATVLKASCQLQNSIILTDHTYWKINTFLVG